MVEQEATASCHAAHGLGFRHAPSSTPLLHPMLHAACASSLDGSELGGHVEREGALQAVIGDVSAMGRSTQEAHDPQHEGASDVSAWNPSGGQQGANCSTGGAAVIGGRCVGPAVQAGQ